MENMKKMMTVVALVAAMGVATAAQAAVLAQYNFNSASKVSSDADATSTAADFAVENGTDDSAASSADSGFSSFSNSTFIRGDATQLTEAAALDDDDYFSFTVTADNVGDGLNLTSLSITGWYQNDTDSGLLTSATVYVQSSVDGFGDGAAVVGSLSIPTEGSANAETAVIGLNVGKFQQLASVEFRFYTAVTTASGELDGTNAGDTIRTDDIILNGAVAPIPEPASLALIGLGSLIALRRRA